MEIQSLLAGEQIGGQTNKNPLVVAKRKIVAQVLAVNKWLQRSGELCPRPIRLNIWPRRRSEAKRGSVPAGVMWSFAGGFVLLRSQSLVTHPHPGGGGGGGAGGGGGGWGLADTVVVFG